jgi:hypothetical protein
LSSKIIQEKNIKEYIIAFSSASVKINKSSMLKIFIEIMETIPLVPGSYLYYPLNLMGDNNLPSISGILFHLVCPVMTYFLSLKFKHLPHLTSTRYFVSSSISS